MTLIPGITMNRVWNLTKRVVKTAPDFALGTGGDDFVNSLRKAVRGTKGADGKYTGGTGYKDFWTKLKNAFKASEEHNKRLIDQEGGFINAMKKNLRDIPTEIKNGWKNGGAVAKAAGKSGLWGSIKGVGKVLNLRMPLIGSILFLATSVPNIVEATWNGGLVDGAAEFVKAGSRAVGSMAGFCIGQALCPIPLVGGIIGGLIGDLVTSKIAGKSYSERQAEKDENPKTTAQAQGAAGFDTGTTNPFAIGGLTADQYMAMQIQKAMMQNPELFTQQYAGSYKG